MKNFLLLLFALLAGCTTYTKPFNISLKSVDRIELFKSEGNILIINIQEKDSIAEIVKIINFNEGMNYESDNIFRLDLIDLPETEENKADTTSLFISNNGRMFRVDKPLKNISGEITSDKSRYYNMSLDIIGYLKAR